MLSKKKRTWFVVADSARARIFTLNPEATALVDVDASLFAPDVLLPARDLKSDRPGRSFSSGRGGLRHAIEPHHDYHKLEKHNFIVRLAAALRDAWTAKKFDALALVAPSRSLGELRATLSAPLKDKVREELAKGFDQAFC
jgi:protein required for attachment to host cells